jgi:hypothetical protein
MEKKKKRKTNKTKENKGWKERKISLFLINIQTVQKEEERNYKRINKG